MKTLIVVGVGALGSHVVQLVRNTGVTISVIDFDRVETKNVQSQFHGKPNVGKTKVESLKKTMDFLFGSKIEVNSNKLVPDNAKVLLGKADVVVDCLDNGAARRVVQDFVRANKIPCLHGALAPDGQFGRVIWDEDFKIDDETGAGAATCENGEHLPFISITSSYMAHALKEFLSKGTKMGFSVSPSGAIRI
jgi:molybdopterin/thiamine biosynthesis adenylyltransferase